MDERIKDLLLISCRQASTQIFDVSAEIPIYLGLFDVAILYGIYSE